MGAHPDWSRYRLSRHLASLWDWRNPAGQLKDMAARTLLLKLEQRGCSATAAAGDAQPHAPEAKARGGTERRVAHCPNAHRTASADLHGSEQARSQLARAF